MSESADARATALPAPTLPVIEIIAIPGCSLSAAPATAPCPHTTLNTPAGSTSAVSSASRSTEYGVSSEGLRMTVLPAANAGPSFQVAMFSG